MEDKTLTPEGINSDLHYQPHTEQIFHRRTQPNEDLILDRNKRLRNEPEAFAQNDYFHQLASIPIIVWEEAVRNGYDLNAPDNEISTRELMRFLRSPKGKMCMVTEEKL